MITEADAAFHAPPEMDYHWAETNFFSFHIPERNIIGSVQTLTRLGLGVTMVDIAVSDRLSLDRRDYLLIDGQQHLPAPAALEDYSLANGLKVTATRAPHDYHVRYASADGVSFDFRFEGLMPPYDIHDPTNAAGADDMARDIYGGGHFDLTGRLKGWLDIRGERVAIDCVDTMDHSWGPRRQAGWGGSGGAWMNVHFGEDHFIHCLMAIDFDRDGAPISLVSGYVVEDGRTHVLTAGKMRGIRLRHHDNLAVTLDLDVVDARGKRHRCYGSALSASGLYQYPNLTIHNTLFRWVSDSGRVGHGTSMEGHMMPYQIARNMLAPTVD